MAMAASLHTGSYHRHRCIRLSGNHRHGPGSGPFVGRPGAVVLVDCPGRREIEILQKETRRSGIHIGRNSCIIGFGGKRRNTLGYPELGDSSCIDGRTMDCDLPASNESEAGARRLHPVTIVSEYLFLIFRQRGCPGSPRQQR